MNETELSRLLAAERSVRPTETQRERSRARLLGALAAGAVPMALAPAPQAAALGVTLKVLAGIGALGVTVAGARAVLDERHETHPAHPAVHAAPPLASAPHDAPPELVEAPSAAPAAPAQEPPPEPAKPAASATSASTFEGELGLLEAAKRELDAGRGYLAVVWLDEHARRYPRGVFSSEREGLRVLVTCPNQAPAARRETAAAFQRAYPTSPLLDRIWRACAETDGDAGAELKVDGGK
ncbi:MAG TPA: hypothetical protein VMI54_05555 [Polyangiaceae bacterium]|nr:hypothetical protein [Polyangiaceae bacterium]